jgi:DNA-binding HxlR family transcriptional regulator
MTGHQPSPYNEPAIAPAADPAPACVRSPATTGPVTVENIVVLETVAKRRWDTAIIVALGPGPARFVELRRATATWMGQRCHPWELSRCRKALIEGGYITGPRAASNEARYALTDRGRARLAVITALSGTIDQQPASRLTIL